MHNKLRMFMILPIYEGTQNSVVYLKMFNIVRSQETVIKWKKGDKEETTQIFTVEEDKKPQITITIVEGRFSEPKVIVEKAKIHQRRS
ncbi:hypothetical protein ABEB36_014853 [Hypothenemus hampei]|uniref:Uncharacterized protein n=1 Tax=Hypothenemus hampei TaxID=57062 RepID=A0ABD1E134_HYPHA